MQAHAPAHRAPICVLEQTASYFTLRLANTSLMIARHLARHSRTTVFNIYNEDVPAVQGEFLYRMSMVVFVTSQSGFFLWMDFVLFACVRDFRI